MTVAKVVVRPIRRPIRVLNEGGQVVRVSALGARGPAGTNHPVQAVLSISGKPTSAPNNAFARYYAPQQAQIDASMCYGYAETPPAAPYSIQLLDQDDTLLAEWSWAAGQNEATVTVSVMTIVEGVRYRFEGNASADAVMADVTLTACWTRTE